ncbi:MAG: response regulator transcription factor [Anaerolineae bacterium]
MLNHNVTQGAMMDEAHHILIVSDNLLARAGLAALLDNQSGIEIVGQTTSDALLHDIDLYQADIVLLNLGWQVSEQLVQIEQLPRDLACVVLLTDEDNTPAVLASLNQFEVYGVLMNETDPDTLLTALKTVGSGLIVLDPTLSFYFNSPGTHNEKLQESLTQRENEVLQLLAQGLTNKGIAHQLGVTDHTIKFHVNAIMTKLGAQSRTEAVVRATRAGLIIL